MIFDSKNKIGFSESESTNSWVQFSHVMQTSDLAHLSLFTFDKTLHFVPSQWNPNIHFQSSEGSSISKYGS